MNKYHNFSSANILWVCNLSARWYFMGSKIVKLLFNELENNGIAIRFK